MKQERGNTQAAGGGVGGVSGAEHKSIADKSADGSLDAHAAVSTRVVFFFFSHGARGFSCPSARWAGLQSRTCRPPPANHSQHSPLAASPSRPVDASQRVTHFFLMRYFDFVQSGGVMGAQLVGGRGGFVSPPPNRHGCAVIAGAVRKREGSVRHSKQCNTLAARAQV